MNYIKLELNYQFIYIKDIYINMYRHKLKRSDCHTV